MKEHIETPEYKTYRVKEDAFDIAQRLYEELKAVKAHSTCSDGQLLKRTIGDATEVTGRFIPLGSVLMGRETEYDIIYLIDYDYYIYADCLEEE